ncbi:MAG TPA: DUF1294 domain-containing protein [Nitrososphaerales archaeon]|nr:DUF1294 domain-containing protein [Nitrososphaerales archaeon]
MNATWDLIAGWLALSSLLGMGLMGLDKNRAMNAGRRIPERTFFIIALVGGAFGILLGSVAFHHKTKKGSFIGVILICAALWIGGLFELGRLVGFPSGSIDPLFFNVVAVCSPTSK